MSILLSNPYEYYLLSFFAKIIELFIVTLIRTWGKSRFHQRTATWQGYIRVFVFPLASLVSTIILLQAFIQYPDAAPQLFACVFILLLSDIAAIVLLDQFETQQQTILDNRVLQQDLKSAHDNITALSSAYATERKLTHDFQNKISVIQGLISESDSNSAALSYLDQLVNQSYTHSLAVTTHRIVVDVVLNQKYLVAVKKAISFRVQLSDLSSFPFTDESFVVVLSNILDNAIEACEKIEDSSKRFVLVKAQSSPEESILYVENSIASRVKIINNRVETTKQNSMQHGYGLQNISAIVKEAGGTYALNSTDEVFSCVIHFN